MNGMSLADLTAIALPLSLLVGAGVILVADLFLPESARRQLAESRQAVLEGLLEGLDRRLRETSESVRHHGEALADLNRRLEDQANRGWKSRARRLIGLNHAATRDAP